jgi:F0F1-type ATP synthase membrane subunit b/b'
MNFDVFLLFFNAVFTTALSAIIVLWILRKQYLPVIRRLEDERAEKASQVDTARSGDSRRER